MFRIRIDPHRHISDALEEALRGWLFNDLSDAMYLNTLERLLNDPERLGHLLDKLDNRFWCAIEERGIEFTDD